MKYRLNPQFIEQKTNDEAVLFDPETSTLHTLNHTGAYIIQCVKKGFGEEVIIKALAKQYNIQPKAALRDCMEYLKLLKKKKILLPRDSRAKKNSSKKAE